MNILAICARPEDVTIRGGGTLAKKAEVILL